LCCGSIDKNKQKRDNELRNGVAVAATMPAPSFTADQNVSDQTNMQRALQLRESKHKNKFQHG